MSEENKELKVGEVVRLRSGGPSMTVTSLKDGVTVSWFAEEGPRWYSFPPESLIRTGADGIYIQQKK